VYMAEMILPILQLQIYIYAPVQMGKFRYMRLRAELSAVLSTRTISVSTRTESSGKETEDRRRKASVWVGRGLRGENMGLETGKVCSCRVILLDVYVPVTVIHLLCGIHPIAWPVVRHLLPFLWFVHGPGNGSRSSCR